MIESWQKDLEVFIKKAERPLVVVLGPTASGKTSFSIQCAEYIDRELGKSSEVINADSRQLYVGLNIGTAKITEEEMQGVPHHLIDVLDPNEEITVAGFKKMAEESINEIHSRSDIPILVGGSMLYISAIIDGLQFAPSADPQLRDELEKEYELDGGLTLYERLKEIDPETAAAFHANNKPYVIRAMEIINATGEPASKIKKRSDCKYDLLIFGMEWLRDELTARITERTSLMFDEGWVGEVQGLMDQGYGPECPAMKSHGYREIMEQIDGGDLDQSELQEIIAAKSRQYAKRQMTWWRRDNRIKWIEPSYAAM